MTKIIIGHTSEYGWVVFEKGRIRFPADCDTHKKILDKMGIYAKFYPVRSGSRAYNQLIIEAPNPRDTIDELRRYSKELNITIYTWDKIKEKLGGLILKAI
jgi:hypothetical protein